MSNYLRLKRPGASYFFTVNLAHRGGALLTDHIAELRRCYARCVTDTPFRTDAIVVLPDHIHAIWTLPEGDADFSSRWRRIKAGFSRSLSISHPRSPSKHRKGERGLWQRRYWEHCLRDPEDFEAHLQYVLCNPVKHGLVSAARDWPYSSIHRDIAQARVPLPGL